MKLWTTLMIAPGLLLLRGSVDRPALAKTLHLRPEQVIILPQTVGYPK